MRAELFSYSSGSGRSSARLFPALCGLTLAFAVAALPGCGDDDDDTGDTGGQKTEGGLLLASEEAPGTPAAQAIADVMDFWKAQPGASPIAQNDKHGGEIAWEDDALEGTPSSTFELTIVLLKGASTPGAADVTVKVNERDAASGGPVIRINAPDGAGHARALYALLDAAGVRYFHPAETFIPKTGGAVTALLNAAKAMQAKVALEAPRFARRGFHEHTQHPIPMSDYLLRPGDAEFRAKASEHLLWLFRNGQNVLSFHLLKTLDFNAWTPYIRDIGEEAARYGIELGFVTSFADQQQNNFRLIDDLAKPHRPQIEASLDRLIATGLKFFTFQIGTSEFTKPADQDVINWLTWTREYMTKKAPAVRYAAWIHTTCSLKADDGDDFFNLPQKVNFPAWVHTTMFYGLTGPAPVYDCETFGNKSAYIDEVKATVKGASLTYFPETAWWLGFDNNMPLALPVTLITRGRDIAKNLPPEVGGHINFTSGTEWSYWLYDYFLTRTTAWSHAGFDGAADWEGFLDVMAPVFGENGAAVVQAVKAYAKAQEQDFLGDHPEMVFYYTGELPQDEIGEKAGVLARRPKPGFKNTLNKSDEEWTAWLAGDFARLQTTFDKYKALAATLPDPADPKLSPEGAEMVRGLLLFTERTEQALRHYEAVVALRPWAVEKKKEAPDTAIKAGAESAAKAKLAAAKALSQIAIDTIRDEEANYRHSAAVLTQPKAGSPTSYKFGYLEETHRGYFWTRRDDQLAELITLTMSETSDAWDPEPTIAAYSTSKTSTLLKPDSAVAKGVITGFIPQLLFGVRDFDATGAAGAGTLTFVMAQDYNENFLPDEGTEKVIVGGEITASATAQSTHLWTGTLDSYELIVRDSSGKLFGNLAVENATVTMHLTLADGAVTKLADVTIDGSTPRDGFVGLITQISGADIETATNLLEGVYKLDPLPEDLPAAFQFKLRAVP
jgi:hypothetical protein